MTHEPKIAFIGAGSTMFMKNIVGDLALEPLLNKAHIALMDIDTARLSESEMLARRLIKSLKAEIKITVHTELLPSLEGADFVVVAFQIGGYKPATVTDFSIPKRYGLRQTIADTLGIGGIMRGLRTVPKLWEICEAMRTACPDALMLQYVNPMAINTWAISAKYPDIKHVGLCHSIQHTIADLAYDLDVPVAQMHFMAAGINHMSFFTTLEHHPSPGETIDLYPSLRQGYDGGHLPKPNRCYPNCPNKIRYEVMKAFGYFVSESSEHFAEYVPWFIKRNRDDLIARFEIPLDEYPRRCEEQVKDWHEMIAGYKHAATIQHQPSGEYAASIMRASWCGVETTVYGNIANKGYIDNLPHGCAVEVACQIDSNGIKPTSFGSLPTQLVGLIRSNVSVQELTVQALLNEDRQHVYHAAMLDPHTAAELDLGAIRAMVDDLILAHRAWLPAWLA